MHNHEVALKQNYPPPQIKTFLEVKANRFSLQDLKLYK